jgi:diadenosine tetraphosphate (Ap4A) HIT family hydrolase
MPADRLCLSCEIVRGNRRPIGGTILETLHFHAHQDVAYPVGGQVIVAAKRHVRNLDDLATAEINELLPLLVKIRAAQRSIIGIDVVYYFYNEDTKHHFHVWMVPRHQWMKQFRRSIEAVRPALLYARAEMSGSSSLDQVQHAVEMLRRELSHGPRLDHPTT